MKWIPWILLLIALLIIGWMIYFPPEDMGEHKEREAFQDTIQVLRDSLTAVKADIVQKSNTVDSTLSKIKEVAKEALKDRDRWRASFKATKARLDTLEGEVYRQAADSAIVDLNSKLDSAALRIEELYISTEVLTGQLAYERDSRAKAMSLMETQVASFEKRLQTVEQDNDQLKKKGKRIKRVLIGGMVLAFIGGVFVN